MPLTKATYRMTSGSEVNLLDFGAVGDGVTDDTSSIQAAFDSISSSNNSVVVFPSGHTFYIKGQIKIKSSCTISGYGSKVLLNGSSWRSHDTSISGAGVFRFPTGVTLTNFNVIGLEFDSGFAGNGLLTRFPDAQLAPMFVSGGYAPTDTNQGYADNAIFRDCQFKGVMGDAILWLTGDRLTVTNCYFENIFVNQSASSGACVQTQGITSAVVDGCTHLHNQSAGEGWHAFVFVDDSGAGSKQIVVDGCSSDNAQVNFVSMESNGSFDNVDAVISNNVVKSCGGFFLNAKGANRINVNGNTVNDCSGFIISIQGRFAMFEGNYVFNTARNAITCLNHSEGSVLCNDNFFQSIGTSGDLDATNPFDRGNCFMFQPASGSNNSAIVSGNRMVGINGQGVTISGSVANGSIISNNQIIDFANQVASSGVNTRHAIVPSNCTVTGNYMNSTTAQNAVVNLFEADYYADNVVTGTYSQAKYKLSTRESWTNTNTFDFDVRLYDKASDRLIVEGASSDTPTGLTAGDIIYYNDPETANAIGGVKPDNTTSNNIKKFGSFNVVHLIDGITAPSSTSGEAKIFVDTSDGDLKVIFGDGTTKTIVVDT